MNKNKKVYIIDRIENGNGGIVGTEILDFIQLRLALKRTPYNYGIHNKIWGFYPVICASKDYNEGVLYFWNDDEDKWNESE